MRGGKLRRKVDIEQPTFAQNGLGEQIASWSVFAANVPAEVAPLNGRERILAQQVNSQLNTRVTLRYIIGIKTSMRIKYQDAGGTRYFQIESFINTDERNREMVVDCVESER
jgi:SPP1 family predicted phage head-tail adaptor